MAGTKAIPAELVGSMYEAAMEPAQWQSVLQRLTGHFDASLGILWTHDFSDDTVHTAGPDPWCIVGADAASIHSFVSYYSRRSVWAPNARHLPEGQTTVSPALYPDHLLPKTEFYADWLRPLDLRYGIGSAVIKQETRDVKLSFLRSDRAGPFAAEEQQRLRDFLPHVRNALQLHRKLRKAQLLADAACAALDRLTFGVVLVGRDGGIVYVNRAAEDLACKTGALSFAGNALRCARPRDEACLQNLVKGAALTGAGAGTRSGGAMRLEGKFGSAHVVVAPMPVAQSPFGTSVSAIVFCSDAHPAPRSLCDAFRAMHGLTCAEAKLADALVAGRTLQEFAEAQGVSINTVRCQLKSISEKTGAHRQADLVRLLLASIPPARDEDPATR